jgi:ankyrin repeat protein
MPTNKSKRQGAKAESANHGNNDDFERMLAEVTAADSELSTDVRTSTTAYTTPTTASKSSSSNSSGGTESSTLKLQVSDVAIFRACKRGDINQLRRWGRKGVRVNSERPLIDSIFAGISVAILRCLVKEVGADAKEARPKYGATPLYIAAQIGDLASVQLLAEELDTDVNQAGPNETMPLYVAARMGHLAVVQCLVTEYTRRKMIV